MVLSLQPSKQGNIRVRRIQQLCGFDPEHAIRLSSLWWASDVCVCGARHPTTKRSSVSLARPYCSVHLMCCKRIHVISCCIRRKTLLECVPRVLTSVHACFSSGTMMCVDSYSRQTHVSHHFLVIFSRPALASKLSVFVLFRDCLTKVQQRAVL